mgnify:CR=1 FL=1
MCLLWLMKHLPVARPQALSQQSWLDLRVGWYESGSASFSWSQSRGPEDDWWLPSRWPACTKEQLSLIPDFKNIIILQFQNEKCDSSTLYQGHQHLNKLHKASRYWFKQQDLTMQLMTTQHRLGGDFYVSLMPFELDLKVQTTSSNSEPLAVGSGLEGTRKKIRWSGMKNLLIFMQC